MGRKKRPYGMEILKKKMRYESRQGEYKAWKSLNSDGVGGWEKD